MLTVLFPTFRTGNTSPAESGRRALKYVATGFIMAMIVAGLTVGVQPLNAVADGYEAAGGLGAVWRDEAAGFEIRRPAACMALQRHGNQLVNFVNQKRRWGITLHRSYLAKRTSCRVLVAEILAQAHKDFTHVHVIAKKSLTVSHHRAAEISMLFTAISNHAPLQLLRQEMLVEINPTEYYVLTFFSPAGDLPAASRLFQSLTGSFRILNMAEITRERLAAVKAGKAWLKKTGVTALVGRFGISIPGTPAAKAPADAPHLNIHAQIRPELFRIRVNHKDIGFVRLHAYVGKRDGFWGVYCNINGREFLPQGAILMTKSVRFWAMRKQPGKAQTTIQYSTWTSAVQRMVPINNPQIVAMRQQRRIINPLTGKSVLEHIHLPYPDFFTHWTQQLGTQQAGFFPVYNKAGKTTGAYRYQCRIHVDRRDDRLIAGARNRPLRFVIGPQMPGLLPSALQYLWPRMVDLRRKSAMAFVVFDSSTNRLGLRILRVLGRQTIQINGKPVRAYHLSDQLDPGVSQLWVTGRGRLLKVLHSDGSTWTPTTDRAMKNRWGRELAGLRQ